jgi:hypothetical protein
VLLPIGHIYELVRKDPAQNILFFRASKYPGRCLD